MFCATVVNFKQKVLIVNNLLGKNCFGKILLIWPYAKNPGWKNMNFQKKYQFELAYWLWLKSICEIQSVRDVYMSLCKCPTLVRLMSTEYVVRHW